VGTVLGIAFRNLLLAKRRTLLLGLAVAVVAALFVTLRAVSSSINERMIESATTLSAGHVNVGGFFKTRRKGSDPILAERSKLKAFVRAKVPEALAVIDRHRGWGRLVSPASSLNAGISGIVFAEEARFFEALRLAPEREYKKDGGDAVRGSFEGLKEPNAALIFAAQAKKLEVGVGDIVTVVTEASGGQSNTVDLRVAAIASDIGFMSNWNVFVLRQTVLDLYKVSPETTGVIMVYLKDPDQATSVMERLRKELAAADFRVMDHDPNPFFMKFDKVAGEDWLGQRLDLTIWSDEISFVMWVTRALDAVSFFVVGILAIIIVGGISNAMAMSVRERTKEIGTMRAIGAQRGFIAGVFLYEALLLGLMASCVGALLAALGLAGLSALELPITSDGVRLFLMANTLEVHAQPLDILVTLGLFSAITGLAALWPAVRASRLRPVEALLATK
jgi:putative ABC transport system permease protein